MFHPPFHVAMKSLDRESASEGSIPIAIDERILKELSAERRRRLPGDLYLRMCIDFPRLRAALTPGRSRPRRPGLGSGRG